MKYSQHIFLLLFLCPLLTWAQDREIKIYKQEDAKSSRFDFENYSKGSYDKANSKAINSKLDNSTYIIDFEGVENDLEVNFSVTTQNDGTDLYVHRDADKWIEFSVSNNEIVSGKISIDGTDYKISVDNRTPDTRIFYTPLIEEKRISYRNVNYSLGAYQNENNIDELLKIWGLEAVSNIQNTASGVDRYSPMFYGSYDWHSSAHGQLIASYAGVKNNDYNSINAVTSRYSSYNISREKYYNPRTNETLYGYPWLLLHADQLAENNPAGYSKLKPFSDYIYNKVKAQVQYVSQSKYLSSLSSGYYNYNFALLGVYTYADRINDENTKTWIKNFLASNGSYINWETVSSRADFLDPKAVAVLLYTKAGITSGTLWNNLVNAYNRENLAIPSQYTFDRYYANSKGLYASKAWGMAVMYKKTNDQKYLNAFNTIMSRMYSSLKSAKNTSYYFNAQGHWLPHFGAFALKVYKDQKFSTNDPVVDPVEPVDPTPADPVDPTPVDPVDPAPVVDLITDINVYPNPFSTYLNIKYPVPADNQKVRVSIVNWIGRTITYKEFYANKGNQEYNFSGLGFLWSETYTLVVQVGNKRYSKRVYKRW